MTLVHETAIIATGAVIGGGVSIGPYSVIGPNVVIGRNTRIGAHVVVEGHTTLGEDNQIFQFASVGSAPQDLKFKGEASRLTIGNKNIIREYVTIQPGTEGGGMITTVGDENLFMVSSHCGHDGTVGNKNVIANCAALGGHVTVGNRVIVGGLSAVHQFCRVGDSSMIAGGAAVTQDVLPYCLVQGDRARTCGLNVIGMERAGIGPEEIVVAKKLYKIIFLKNSPTLKERVERARIEFEPLPPITKMLDFIEHSERGIALARRGGADA